MLLALSLASPAALAVYIEVRALFGGAAVLSIDGREQMLKVGEKSDEGVLLVSASSKEAEISYGGETKTIYLSDLIGAEFEPPKKAQLVIQMTPNRQYITHGTINGRSVRYLVDTGANVVAISRTMAVSLGIDLADGIETVARTASDQSTVTMVRIAEMQVGPIKQQNVPAVVMNGDYPKDVLLGMSFLQHVDISENAGLMMLEARY